MMQKKFTLYNFETFRSRDHGSVPVITGAACDVITGAACDVITGTFPIGRFWHPTERCTGWVNKIAAFFGPTSDCNHLGTLCPNHLKFTVQVVPTMDHCRLKFQVIRTNGSQVIAVGSLS